MDSSSFPLFKFSLDHNSDKEHCTVLMQTSADTKDGLFLLILSRVVRDYFYNYCLVFLL